jgi:purine nucleosidase
MKKIILDCDPGHDDALALLLAYANPAVELVAVTTVAGNQTVEKVTENTRRVMSLAGIRNVPLAKGADRPLLRELTHGGYIHGETGLDGYDFPASDIQLDKRHAVDLIIDLLHGKDNITLVPTATLTNIALALRTDPSIMSNIEEIVLMGGSYSRGNREPLAEANIFNDAEAADIVFRSGLPITMVGLDLTHQAKATPEVVERIRAINNEVARMAVGLINFFASTYRQHFKFDAPPIHDACAVARVINPDIVKTRFTNVVVETHGLYTYGATVCDFDERTGRPANVNVATHLDVEKFWKLMLDALATYS